MNSSGRAVTSTTASEPSARPSSRWRRRALWLGLALGLPALLALGAWRYLLVTLEQQVLAALGPESSLQSIEIRWPGVVAVTGLRVTAPEGWPAPETLRAERVEVTPDLRTLSSPRVHIRKVEVHGAYLSVRRSTEGRLELLPSLVQRATQAQGDAAADSGVAFADIAFHDAQLDFYDASIRRPPLQLRLDAVQAQLLDLRVPERDTRSALSLRATVKGPAHDGQLALDGWLVFATRESDLRVTLRGVDLVALEPYLVKPNEASVRRGRLDLDLHSTVSGRQLRAPGTLVLSGLELASRSGVKNTFMGVPRKAVLTALAAGDDSISLDFTLEGDLDNPRFSLNETLSVRVAVGMAESLGVGLVDIVKDVGQFGSRAVEATGDALGRLFGGGDEAP